MDRKAILEVICEIAEDARDELLKGRSDDPSAYNAIRVILNAAARKLATVDRDTASATTDKPS